MQRLVIALSLGAALAGCSTTRSEPEFLVKPEAATMPFSSAVRAGGLLFLAGRIGTDSSGQLVAGGIKAETRQAMENIGAELRSAGTSFDRVVKCTVFLANMAEWEAMNEVYVTYFAEGKRPARSAVGVGVNGLARNARVEIECIAGV